MSHILHLVVDQANHKTRFDIAATRLSGLSRNKIRQLIDSGLAFLNKQRIWIAKFQVKQGDILELMVESRNFKSSLDTDFQPSSIIVDNADFLVINKPAGIAVDTASNNIINYLKKFNSKYSNLLLAHRLDKDTSGLLILVKRESVRREFEQIFKERRIHKIYHTICFDTPKPEEGEIIFPIVRHSQGKNKYFAITSKDIPNPKAKSAKTSYKLIHSFTDKRLSYLECIPHTGRPHQIRVHLKSIGNPVLGDKVYANHLQHHPYWQKATRQMLHAYSLKFKFAGQEYNLTAPIPSDFENILKEFRLNS